MLNFASLTRALEKNDIPRASAGNLIWGFIKVYVASAVGQIDGAPEGLNYEQELDEITGFAGIYDCDVPRNRADTRSQHQ